MNSNTLFLFILALSVIPLSRVYASSNCNRTCGKTQLSYPFGFSNGCRIRLNCSSDEQMLINGFSIQTIDFERIKIAIGAECNRSLSLLGSFYTKNYAPTARNAILLDKCRHTAISCSLPLIDVKTRFESLNCDSNNGSNISCYSGKKFTGYLNFSAVNQVGCEKFLSVISAQTSGKSFSAVSLDIQVIELGWWLNGHCNCSTNKCIKLQTPSGPGYRCECEEGFVGDGYPGGSGCRPKASVSNCNAARYLSAQCGGSSKFAIFVSGTGIGVVLLSLSLVYFFVRRRSSSKSKGYIKHLLSENSSISIPIYPYKEIEKATNNFSDKQRLGIGAYGTVYAGKLQSDLWVAIKRIRHRDADSIDQVMNEINLISSVNHPNLVKLLGCSIEDGEQILVYEFMPNGTLCQHLQRERGEGLPWAVRLSVATETAQAIAHLHESVNPPIYHRDIKSSNILLDYNYKSKVADFGLSRLGRPEISHISTAPQGTPGYLDPEYHQNFHLSDKSDVYSFGVVLVEIITAMKVLDFSRSTNEINLAALATDRIVNGRLNEIVDPLIELHSDEWIISSVHKVAELAFRCLASHKEMRPSMMEVAVELEQIRISRWGLSDDIKHQGSSGIGSTSSSNLSLNLQSMRVNTGDLSLVESEDVVTVDVDGAEMEKDGSPVSIQDAWPSEQSSPSSNSLLSNVIQ